MLCLPKLEFFRLLQQPPIKEYLAFGSQITLLQMEASWIVLVKSLQAVSIKDSVSVFSDLELKINKGILLILKGIKG